MLKKIQEQIKKLIISAGFEMEAELSIPPKVEMGDYAFPVFSLAKKAGKNPVELAKEMTNNISSKLEGTVVQKVQAFGPYVNFFLRSEALANTVLKEIEAKKDKFGFDKSKKTEKVMVEFGQANTHKEFHIGHARNAVMGDFVASLFKLNGFKVLSVNYPGDMGAHVAKCLWYVKKINAGAPKTNKGRWLGQMYADASKLIDEKPELKDEVAEVQQKIEAGDKEWVAFWKQTREWSLDSLKKHFETLGIKFDEWFFESEVEKPGKKFVQELVKKGVAKPGEKGALIVDLSEYGLDVFLVLKSDGTSLYSTKDLALAQEKFKRYKIDKSIYVVDNRQRQYFAQLFKTLELVGWKKDMVFLGYEFVTLPGGAMSSRKGNVVLFEDLYNEVAGYLRKETVGRHTEWEEKQIQETVKTLSLAAIKFDLLKHPIDKAIVFDVKEAASFEGFSGPYILYVIARINSLAAKAKKEKVRPGKSFVRLTTAEEKKLLLKIADASEIMQKALKEYNPSIIARYVFELAQSFNDFYNKHSVLSAEGAETKGERLALSLAVKQVLMNMLSVLNIGIVEEM